MDTPTVRPTLTTLSAEECYRLLGTRQIGRLGVIAEHYPLIFPVTYAMDGYVVVFRSRPGLKLDSLEHANVTFQVDEIDERTRSGWSVMVRGQAEQVGDDHSHLIVSRTHDTGVQPWAPGDDFRWVRLISHGVTGRRIVPGEPEDWAFGTAAYM
jgi:nitroimidazol reductase NimA-like FMN-containing flavoprotein (pyridoxamine 5'-phosphate oxidase superfamily)